MFGTLCVESASWVSSLMADMSRPTSQDLRYLCHGFVVLSAGCLICSRVGMASLQMNDPAKGFVTSNIKPGPPRPPRLSQDLIAEGGEDPIDAPDAPVGSGRSNGSQPVATPGCVDVARATPTQRSAQFVIFPAAAL